MHKRKAGFEADEPQAKWPRAPCVRAPCVPLDDNLLSVVMRFLSLGELARMAAVQRSWLAAVAKPCNLRRFYDVTDLDASWGTGAVARHVTCVECLTDEGGPRAEAFLADMAQRLPWLVNLSADRPHRRPRAAPARRAPAVPGQPAVRADRAAARAAGVPRGGAPGYAGAGHGRAESARAAVAGRVQIGRGVHRYAARSTGARACVDATGASGRRARSHGASYRAVPVRPDPRFEPDAIVPHPLLRELRLTSSAAVSLQPLAAMPELRVLGLTGPGFAPPPPFTSFLAGLPQLCELELKSLAWITNLAFLGPSLQTSQLTALSIDGCRLRANEETFCLLVSQRALKTLSLFLTFVDPFDELKKHLKLRMPSLELYMT
jgi:hypothetical protein